MIIIRCISITNNVKSYKKITETAQTFNFSDFPLKRDESYSNANAETVGQNQFFKKIRWS